MEIDDDLKEELIASVENILEIDLDEQTKLDLERSLEITLAVHVPALNISLGTTVSEPQKVCGLNVVSLDESEAEAYVCPKCKSKHVVDWIIDNKYICAECEHQWAHES